MQKLWILALFFGLSPLFADEVICVRNWLTTGMNTCESFPKDYTYLVNIDPDAMFETCARIRPDSFCEMTTDFAWVFSKAKKKVCTDRYDNAVANMCNQDPKNYVWVRVNG